MSTVFLEKLIVPYLAREILQHFLEASEHKSLLQKKINNVVIYYEMPLCELHRCNRTEYSGDVSSERQARNSAVLR